MSTIAPFNGAIIVLRQWMAQLLVNEIVLTGKNIKVKGGYVPLVGAVKLMAQKKETEHSARSTQFQ